MRNTSADVRLLSPKLTQGCNAILKQAQQAAYLSVYRSCWCGCLLAGADVLAGPPDAVAAMSAPAAGVATAAEGSCAEVLQEMLAANHCRTRQ